MPDFAQDAWIVGIDADEQTDTGADEEVNNAEKGNNLHLFIIIAIQNMKAASNSNRRYFFGDYLTRPKSKHQSRGSSASRKKKLQDDKNRLNTNQTFREYFPDSESNGNQSSTFSNILSPAHRHYSRESGSERGSNDHTINTSQKSTRFQFQKQISRLTAELENKERELFQNKASKAEKIKESELVQLYRTINFYEGKMRKLEEQLKRYEATFKNIGKNCDQKSQHKSQVEKLVLLFEQMRTDNEKLSGTVEQKDYEIGRLNDKIKKIQLKNTLYGKKTMLKRTQNASNTSLSREKSQLSMRTFKSATNFSLKKDMYGNIHSKINTIESSLNFLKKENDKLNEEIDEKDRNIEKLEKQLSQMRDRFIFQCDLERKSKIKQSREGSKISLRNKTPKESMTQKRDSSSSLIRKGYKKDDPLNQVVVLPKKLLRETIRPDQEQIPVSEKAAKPSDKYPNLTKQIRSDILRRIKYQLITEQVSYEDLLKVLSSDENEAEVFEEYPYNLASDEAEWLCEWLQNMQETIGNGENSEAELMNYLKIVIPRYETVSLRQENNLKIQIYNCYLNRQEQFLKHLNKNQNQKQSFSQILQFFGGWPLTDRHLDIIGKNLYEDTGSILEQTLETVQKMILKWGSP